MEELIETVQEQELKQWCYANYHDGLCDICPRVQECNAYIYTHKHSPIDTTHDEQ